MCNWCPPVSVLCSFRSLLSFPMYLFIPLLSLACMLLCLVGLKEYGLETQSIGLDWPLSEIGTRLEQQTCSIPHCLIIRACLPVLETENKQQQQQHKWTEFRKSHSNKLSILWPAMLYYLIQTSMNYLKYISMLSDIQPVTIIIYISTVENWPELKKVIR